MVYNTRNGSVKIICGGGDCDIGEFLQEIRTRGERRGAVIIDIKEQEIDLDIKDLPYPLSRVLADEDIDLGRKADKIYGAIIDIKGDTKVLPEIKTGIDSLNTKFDSFNIGQEGHNLRLEKILEKLAEK